MDVGKHEDQLFSYDKMIDVKQTMNLQEFSSTRLWCERFKWPRVQQTPILPSDGSNKRNRVNNPPSKSYLLI